MDLNWHLDVMLKSEGFLHVVLFFLLYGLGFQSLSHLHIIGLTISPWCTTN